MKVRVSLRTTGCKVAQWDGEAVLRAISDLPVEVVSPTEPADIAVVNACTVTAAADRDGRAALYRAMGSGASLVVLTGCLAVRVGDVPPGVTVVPATSDRSALIDLLRKEISRLGAGGEGGVKGPKARSRPLVKVQDGCDGKCAYCIVPLVRGPSVSYPVESIEKAVLEARDSGASEVVITGVDLGAYGRESGSDLASLLRRLVGLRTGMRFRISSLEPNWVTDQLVGLMADSPDICKHLHIPLQSGSDKVLLAMRRPYDTRTFASVVLDAASRVPGLCLGLDVICGFPGETDDDFETTRKFLSSLPFSYLHVFPFSPRPGTEAFAMEGACGDARRKERCRILREMGRKARALHARSLVGKEVEVVDIREQSGQVEALTQNYVRVRRGGVVRRGRYSLVPCDTLGEVLLA